MAEVTSKRMSEKDANQVLKYAYNDNDATLSTSGFVDGKIGHRIKTEAISSTIDENSYFDEVNVQSATFASGSPTVTISSTVGMVVGQFVLLDVGQAGIPDGTTIQSIDSNTQLTMSDNASVTGAFDAHFANLLKKIRIAYNNSSHDILLDAARIE